MSKKNLVPPKIKTNWLEIIKYDHKRLSAVCDGRRHWVPGICQNIKPIIYITGYKNSEELLKDATPITLTTDAWTSYKNESYNAVTACYIDSNFTLKSILLEVNSIDKRHTSINLAQEIRRVIADWNIEKKKILLAISDNAANIKRTISEELKWWH